MSEPTNSETTVANIGVALFSVADQEAALKFYTEKLGFWWSPRKSFTAEFMNSTPN